MGATCHWFTTIGCKSHIFRWTCFVISAPGDWISWFAAARMLAACIENAAP